MHKILKDIGVREMNKDLMKDEFFTPDEYKARFEKVSKERFEDQWRKLKN